MHQGVQGTAVGIAALAAAILPSAAYAQSGAPQADPADPTEIVITATRRTSPLSTVPIAVSAIAADTLSASGGTDLRGLNQLAPSLLISSTGSEANAVARVRGVGTVGDNPGLESSVGVFIDGVYRARTGSALNELGEIERVEVLRGPQGTLFGRNTSAGLINIVTKSPAFQLGGSAEASYGNYDYWRAAARVTGPLSATVAASIEGLYVKRDGFLDLVDTAGRVVGDTNDRDRYLVRGQLLLKPTDRFSLRLIADYAHRDESCCGAVYTDVGEETGTSPAAASPNPTNRIVTILQRLGTVFPNGENVYAQDPYRRRISITPGRDYVSRGTDWGLSAEANYEFDSGIKLTSITAWRDYKSADYGDYDYSTADLIYRGPGTHRQFKTLSQELRAQGTAFANRLDWLVGAYYAHEELTLRDDIRFGRQYGAFAACRLLAGANDTSPAAPALACDNPAVLSLQIAGAVANPILRDGLQRLASIGDSGDVNNRYFQETDNVALFTHNIVHVSPTVDLTLGGRYTFERKTFAAAFDNDNLVCPTLQARNPGATNDIPDFTAFANNPSAALRQAAALAGGILTLGCLGNGSPGLNALSLNDRITNGQFSGTAVVSWKPVDRLLLYASYSRGYKAGGYNLDRFELGNVGTNAANSSPATFFSPRSNGDAPSLRFEPETVNAFEIGIKYSQPRWSANIAAFRQEFSNFQLNTFNGTSFIVQNIEGCDAPVSPTTGTCANGDTQAGLISQGVELELAVNPLRNLRLSSGLSYTDTRFADNLVGSRDGRTPLDPALFLLPGSRNNNAPEWVGTASIAFTPQLGTSGLSALFYVDGRATSSYDTGSDLYPEKLQDGYAIVNARIGLRGREQSWAVEFWGQNIFDQDYSQVTINSPLQSSSPNNQSVAQLGRVYNGQRTTMSNQLFSSYLGEPRTYGVTLKTRF